MSWHTPHPHPLPQEREKRRLALDLETRAHRRGRPLRPHARRPAQEIWVTISPAPGEGTPQDGGWIVESVSVVDPVGSPRSRRRSTACVTATRGTSDSQDFRLSRLQTLKTSDSQDFRLPRLATLKTLDFPLRLDFGFLLPCS